MIETSPWIKLAIMLTANASLDKMHDEVADKHFKLPKNN